MADSVLDYDNIIWKVFAVGIISSVIHNLKNIFLNVK